MAKGAHLAIATLTVLLAGAIGVALAASPTTEWASVQSDGSAFPAMYSSLNPAISASGRYVAFDDTYGNKGNILYVRDTEADQTTEVAGARSFDPSISSSGRYVVFISTAQLTPQDANGGIADIFVRDLVSGQTSIASLRSDGSAVAHNSYAPALSADGRLVAFVSQAHFVPHDTSYAYGTNDDVFVRSLAAARTFRASVDSGGTGCGGYEPSVSSTGRFVAFSSLGHCALGDGGGDSDVFVRDRRTGRTTRVSVGPGGAERPGESSHAAISGGGRFIAFLSTVGFSGRDHQQPPNLDPDVYVKDRLTGEVRLADVASDGAIMGSGLRRFNAPAISADGRFVAFVSAKPAPNGYGDSAVFVHDRQTGDTTEVSMTAGGAEPASPSFSFTPALSRDGSYAAFASTGHLDPGDSSHYTDIYVRGPLF